MHVQSSISVPVLQSATLTQLEKKPEKLQSFVQTLLQSKRAIEFEDDRTYQRFIGILQKMRKDGVYKTALNHFRNLRGLPDAPKEVPHNVHFAFSGETLLFSCPKDFLPSVPYFERIFEFGLKELQTNNEGIFTVESKLSKEALIAFKSYIFTGKIGQLEISALIELKEFAEMIECAELKELIDRAIFDYYLDDSHEFNPEHLEDCSVEFTKAYLEKRAIAFTDTASYPFGIQIALTDFLQLFQQDKPKLLEFIAEEIGSIRIDTDNLALLPLIKKRYRRAIYRVEMMQVSNRHHLEQWEFLYTALPNNRLKQVMINDEFRSQEMSAHEHALLGHLLLSVGQPDLAEEQLTKAHGLDPESCFAIVGLGLVYVSKKQPTEAKKEFQKALQKNPNSALALSQLGYILNDERRFDEAEEYLRKAAAAGAKGIYSTLGLRCWKKKSYEEDEQFSRLEIQYNPKNLNSQIELAITLIQTKKSKEAEKIMRKVLKRETNDAEAYETLGRALYLNEEYQEAEDLFYKALQLEPDSLGPHSLTYFGDCLLSKDKLEDAEKYLRKANESLPSTTFILSRLGEVLRRKKQYDEAESTLRKALELGSGSYSEETLGAVLLEKGQYEEAEEHLQKALKLGEPSGFAYAKLAEIRRRQGRLDEAKALAEKGLEVMPESKAAKEVLAKLASSSTADLL